MSKDAVSSQPPILEKHPSPEQLDTTKNKLSKAQEELIAIIHSMNENPSFIHCRAQEWNELSLEEKIIAGLFCLLLAVVLGLLFSGTAFMFTLAISISIYVTIDFILTNYLENSLNAIDRLETGLSSLADLLTSTITALTSIKLHLNQVTENMQDENAKLSSNVENLNGKLETLRLEADQLATTEQSLLLTKEGLEKTTNALELSLAKQKELVRITQSQLEQYNRQSQENTGDLESQKSKLQTELDKVTTNLKTEAMLIEALKQLNIQLIEAGLQSIASETNFQDTLGGLHQNLSTYFLDNLGTVCEAEVKQANLADNIKINLEKCTNVTKKIQAVEPQLTQVLQQLDELTKQVQPKALHKESAKQPDFNRKQTPVFFKEQQGSKPSQESHLILGA